MRTAGPCEEEEFGSSVGICRSAMLPVLAIPADVAATGLSSTATVTATAVDVGSGAESEGGPRGVTVGGLCPILARAAVTSSEFHREASS